jgi:hypothetical protein
VFGLEVKEVTDTWSRCVESRKTVRGGDFSTRLERSVEGLLNPPKERVRNVCRLSRRDQEVRSSSEVSFTARYNWALKSCTQLEVLVGNHIHISA